MNKTFIPVAALVMIASLACLPLGAKERKGSTVKMTMESQEIVRQNLERLKRHARE